MTTETTGPALPYGTPEAPRVAVRGDARLEVDPELARIYVGVEARGKDRRSTVDDLTRRNTAVLELLRSYGDAVERLETGAFSVTPELVDRTVGRIGSKGERVRAYHGRVRITAELGDFTALGELTTRLADMELTSVAGPWWKLRPDSPAYREVRQRAVREAVQRAREYAEALDTTLVTLVELADIGAEGPAQPSPPPMAYGAAPRAAAPGAAAPPPALDLEPQRQHLQASVHARFTMAPPRL
jgi:uncharacterized protein